MINHWISGYPMAVQTVRKWVESILLKKPGSMYGIYANIWSILMVNVIIYSIHGSYGIGMVIGLGTNWNNHEQPPLEHNFNKKTEKNPNLR